MALAPQPEASLDQQEASQQTRFSPGDHADDALRCTWYPDAMLIETQPDSPATGPSFLVKRVPGGARPACAAFNKAGGVRLETSETLLLGRKGPFLIFDSTDALGAEPFLIVHLPEGRIIYTDSRRSGHFEAVTLAGGVLRLRYARESDAPCSLPKEGATCWSRAMKAGHFARAIASQPPPLAGCARSYEAAKAAQELTSAISYDVDMTLGGDGHATVLSRGALDCSPEE